MRAIDSKSRDRSAARAAFITGGVICALLIMGCSDETTGNTGNTDGSAATSPTDTPSSTQSGTGSATISWTPPQQNTDGSYASDLAGYKIYYGNSANNLSNVVHIATPGITVYVLSNLAQGTWYFAMGAYNSLGAEGPLSEVASKVIS